MSDFAGFSLADGRPTGHNSLIAVYSTGTPMLRASMFALLGVVVLVAGGSVGQDPKKDDPPKAARKDDPPAKVKGSLPQNWGKIGLTDDQKQEVYKVQAKYAAEIEKLEAKIREAKAARDKEMKAVLTAEQKKALADIITNKSK